MMTQDEFEEMLADPDKRITQDISWSPDEDSSPVLEFRVKVDSDADYPLIIKGSYNSLAQTLSYALIHRNCGRVYGLDIGTEHRNPDGEYVGTYHRHWWDEGWRDKLAYVPENITASIADPVRVWEEFCKSIQIVHDGFIEDPQVPAELE